MTDFKDDELEASIKSFLKKNLPSPPSASPDEIDIILRKIEPAPKLQLKWFAIPTVALAGLLVFWMSLQTPKMVPAPLSTTIVQPEVIVDQTVGMLDEDDFDLFDEESPTLEIGEDYLILAGL